MLGAFVKENIAHGHVNEVKAERRWRDILRHKSAGARSEPVFAEGVDHDEPRADGERDADGAEEIIEQEADRRERVLGRELGTLLGVLRELQELEDNAGTQFDPELVRAFATIDLSRYDQLVSRQQEQNAAGGLRIRVRGAAA